LKTFWYCNERLKQKKKKRAKLLRDLISSLVDLEPVGLGMFLGDGWLTGIDNEGPEDESD